MVLLAWSTRRITMFTSLLESGADRGDRRNDQMAERIGGTFVERQNLHTPFLGAKYLHRQP
jgi:hypothetical protein